MGLGSLLKSALKFGYETASPTTKTGRTIAATVAGGFVGGPAGAAAGYGAANSLNASIDASKNAKEQGRIQANQASELAKQQKLADSRLLAERARVDQSLSRLSRGKVRGSLFGTPEQGLGTAGAPGATLG